MPSCSGRNILYVLLTLQLISTLERQIFDFLGFMWVPILANFLHTIVVILGIFGVYQYTSRHILTYLVWCLVWIAWNIFLICYYLEVGSLRIGAPQDHEDLLSFGTGSYSWWYTNNIGCIPNLNTTFETLLPNVFNPKPSSVSGCLLDDEYVEVIHASIQVFLAILALLFGIPLAHYLISVVEPKYRHAKGGQKQAMANGHAMYSIEYNQVNENNHHTAASATTNPQENDFYSLESGPGAVGNGNLNGEARPHMTPRRVKRRSYTRSSARSAGKALKKDTHNNRQSGRSVRSASGAIGAVKDRASKSINPVTRLIQEPEPRPLINDSSTSNEDKNIERYGQVNPGYVSSRPNSLYSHANNVPQSITDYEASRPPSALTSYSNFHGQRRPAVTGAGGFQKPPAGMNQLTQESLNQYGDNNGRGAPGAIGAQGPASLLTGALPKTQQPQLNASFDDDLPPPPPPLSSSPTLPLRNGYLLGGGGEDTDNNSSIATDTTAQMPVPLQRNMPNNRRNEYVNMPVGSSMPNSSVNPNPMPINNDLHSLSSASPDLSNHHHAPPPLPPHNYANMPINKNPLPPPRQEEPVQQPRQYNQFRGNQRYTDNQQQQQHHSSDQEPLSYNDTQTLRADQKLEYPPPLKEVPQFIVNGDLNHQVVDGGASGRPHFREVHLDYDSRTAETKAEPQQATRIPTGHARRDNRSSLRMKHRKEMEQAQMRKKSQQQEHKQYQQQQQQQTKQQQHQTSREEDEYGFAAGGATALPPTSNGFHNPNQPEDSNDPDKWYMHDSMRPVGAPVHGGNCKCYRCQRKLTAI